MLRTNYVCGITSQILSSFTRKSASKEYTKMGVKDIIDREFTHASPEVRRANVELLRSAAIFFGSVVFMRAFGELMAI